MTFVRQDSGEANFWIKWGANDNELEPIGLLPILTTKPFTEQLIDNVNYIGSDEIGVERIGS